MTEVRNLPEEKISFKQHTFEKFLGKYTGIGSTEHPEAINAIRLDLTRNLGKLLGDLQDEVKFCFNKEIGSTPDWKQITVYPTVVQIVAGLSARAFVGLPLCRDKEWTDATMAFTKDAIILMHMNSMIPLALRPYLSPLLPPFRKLAGYRTFAGNKLKPQVEFILNKYKEKLRGFKTMTEDEAMAEAEKNNFNLVHWMIGHFKDPETADAFELGQQQMTAAFAAIHTTGMAGSHAIFDLAAYPEYIPILREEIENVIEEEGFSDRQLRKTSMAKLKKLDSFVKESARMSPPTIVAMNRIVTSPTGIDLSTGHHLPYRTVCGFGHPFYPTSTVPSDYIVRSEGQPPLTKFYPFRYSELRSIPGQENSHQFVTSDPNNINFGYGRNVCPGRFFASNEVKVILVELLMNYDVGLGPNGEGVKENYERPKIMEFGPNYMPDMKAKVWIRERKTKS
ncbi:Cytochrome P450 monooxygenase ataF [Lachnellula suecica]|uniref:Cytochrome P450 monooxygenase ataF n=1 Tax=Lachnellula suecica TaxID=602035 RepID=A0A8T9CH92_9HELO|nr:Cytochrome P450 monooxygenase ataF [Lachnellula suecica]